MAARPDDEGGSLNPDPLEVSTMGRPHFHFNPNDGEAMFSRSVLSKARESSGVHQDSSPSRESREPPRTSSCASVYSDEEIVENSNLSNDSSDDDDDDEWGTVHNGLDFSIGSSCDEEAALFIPEPVIQLSCNRQRPPLTSYSEDELKPGSQVWVVDQEDVEVLLHNHWSTAYASVCNGKQSGTVVRHIHDMTLVRFHDSCSDMCFSLTLPRTCLSLNPIAPYETLPSVECRNTAAYYSNLGPRSSHPGTLDAGGLRDNKDLLASSTYQAKQAVRWQYYEEFSAPYSQLYGCDGLGTANSCFNSEDFQGALKHVNEWMTTHEGDQHMVDALIFRSCTHVFLGQYNEALADARRCVELDPLWIRGYLSMARAYSGLGKFSEADRAIQHSLALLTNSASLDCIYAMNFYLMELQRRLQRSSATYLTLDGLYRKCLKPQRDFQAGEVIETEAIPIVAMSSVLKSHPSGRCCVCFRDGAELFSTAEMWRSASPRSPVINPERVPQDAPPSSLAFFCSDLCKKRASLFHSLENGRHREGVQRARELIVNKATVVVNTLPLEMANMTMRLFFMVITTHRRLSLQQNGQLKHNNTRAQTSRTPLTEPSSPSTSFEEAFDRRPPQMKLLDVTMALQHLGIYPLVSDHVSIRTRKELHYLYETLTCAFVPEEKTIYNFELFVRLYNYIEAYCTPIDVVTDMTSPKGSLASSFKSSSSSRSRLQLFYLPFLIGAVGRETSYGMSTDFTSREEASELGLGVGGGAFGRNAKPGREPNCEVRLVDSDTNIRSTTSRGSDRNRCNCSEEPQPLLQLVARTALPADSTLVFPSFVVGLD